MIMTEQIEFEDGQGRLTKIICVAVTETKTWSGSSAINQ